jgi:predicted transcriptional regulator
MSVKDQLHEVADNLPDGATYEDAMQAIYVRAKIAEGERQVALGQVMSHDDAMRQLSRWLT